MGKKRQPLYKVVAADVRSPRDGKYIEVIGSYNPKTDPTTIEIKEDRALYWLGCGAQPTDTVKNLLNKKGILLKKELIREGLSEEAISARLEDWSKNKEASLEKKKGKAEQKKKELTDSAKKKLDEELKEKGKKASEAKDTASEEVSPEKADAE